ncbi:LacI family DNA-binding transcriptional regulator [Streptomyces cyaneofuscatus]|uniref:LacI family DNA-binding transcriptional regulator n=1 Tax=Streptomyces TaxID=1883 RepID=UPI000978F8DF|nr:MULTISPECIES: LacI family DNA-binding transcriptional regulator [unclassified Streptomyces]ONI53207.1 HTH-type transcriptional repressor CytR [Streptomyces sp. IB2014 011-1]RDV50887.1 LacI family transcriptional regulator [Streptomyces sp. IB2014 011-12]CAD5924782.1 HTH-type transcriptional regulator CelR [Streptomyces sp. KY70]CAD5990488.1 HTH-type transcriptional regulator CelR [Streptomyces sp. KY75]
MTAEVEPPVRPTLEDVAAVAGVSRATVSRVINGATTVDPALRTVVEEAVATTGYVPNRAARSLVTRRTDSVALVISERERRPDSEPFAGRMFSDPYFGRVVSGLLEVLRPAGIQMVLMLADDATSRTQLLSYLRHGHVDGVVLVTSHADDPLPHLLQETRLPAVLAGRPPGPSSLAYVEVDQQAGARLAADHLAALGRRRIGTISGPQDRPAGQVRLAGFLAALAAHGIEDVACAEGDFTHLGGAAAMRRLLAEQPGLDGVFIASDLMALGALPVLQRAGRDVPSDVAVVGFDDSSAAAACDPPLTTVRQPVEEMAAEMARLLLKQIGGPGGPSPSMVFPPTLVRRQSA